MKPTLCLFAAPLVVCMVSAKAGQEAEQQARLNESLAYARLVAATGLPTVTYEQCVSVLGDWSERDKADKQGGPYWYEKVSTEELTRIVGLSTACGTETMKGHTTPKSIGLGAFVARTSLFESVLLRRAREVLHNHSLIEEYLLQP